MDKIFQNSIHNAIIEDTNFTDKATSTLVGNKQECFATFLVRNSGIVAGVEAIVELYHQINPNLDVEILKEEGTYINKGDAIASVKGKMVDVLKGSNIAINYLQHASSIATITDKYLDELVNTNCEFVIDNQYTPNCRRIEENAVLHLGCLLRIPDESTIIINENHLLVSESITAAVEMVRKKFPLSSIELEVKTKDEFLEAIETSVNKITLLNIKDNELIDILQEPHYDIKVGISNNYSLGKVRSIAKMGVDYIIINNLKTMSKGLDVYLKVYKRSIKNNH